MTALLLLGAGHADAVSGAGVRGVGAVPLLRRPRAGAGRAPCARAAREFLAQFPSVATARRSACGSPIPAARDDLRALQARLRASARRTPPPTRCTATCCGCGARTRCSALSARTRVDGAVLGPEAFVLRFFGENGSDRLLLVNLGRDLDLDSAPEPLLAPPAGMRVDGRLVERGSELRRDGNGARRNGRRVAHPRRAAVVLDART